MSIINVNTDATFYNQIEIKSKPIKDKHVITKEYLEEQLKDVKPGVPIDPEFLADLVKDLIEKGTPINIDIPPDQLREAMDMFVNESGLSIYDTWRGLYTLGAEEGGTDLEFIPWIEYMLSTLKGDKGEKGDSIIGPEGKSAYQLWLDSGNSGSLEDFMDIININSYDAWRRISDQGGTNLEFLNWIQELIESLKGDKGDQGDSIIGPDGKSSYELWLDSGNNGTLEDFLDIINVNSYDIWRKLKDKNETDLEFIDWTKELLNSLKGDKGDKGDSVIGSEGKSAYDLWIDSGNNGNVEDFLDIINVNSYDIWRRLTEQGKTDLEFLDWAQELLNSLKGDKGEKGDSIVGPDGKSAYEIWLDEGNIGTEEDFLNIVNINSYDIWTRLKDIGETELEYIEWASELINNGSMKLNSYDMAVQNGYEGTFLEWFKNLNQITAYNAWEDSTRIGLTDLSFGDWVGKYIRSDKVTGFTCLVNNNITIPVNTWIRIPLKKYTGSGKIISLQDQEGVIDAFEVETEGWYTLSTSLGLTTAQTNAQRAHAKLSIFNPSTNYKEIIIAYDGTIGIYYINLCGVYYLEKGARVCLQVYSPIANSILAASVNNEVYPVISGALMGGYEINDKGEI